MTWVYGTVSTYTDLASAVTDIATSRHIASASVVNAGSSYDVGDRLMIVGGDWSFQGEVEITSVEAAGSVATWRIANNGSYSSATATSIVSTTTDSSAGNGATVEVSFASTGWSLVHTSAYVSGTSDVQTVLKGEGDGTDEIYVGIRTFQDSGAGYYNWELKGFTGYSSALPWDEQPGVSPGEFDAATTNLQAGAYVPLRDASIQFWLNINSYRMILVAKVGVAYMNAYLGFINRFGTTSEYPYPLYIAGCVSKYSKLFNESTLMSGACDPWKTNEVPGSFRGPGFLRFTDNSWYDINNSSISAGTRQQTTDRVILPAGNITTPGSLGDEDIAWMQKNLSGAEFDAFWVDNGLGSNPYNIGRTQGDDGVMLFQTMFFWDSPSYQMPGELSDVFLANAFGGLVSEDRIIVDGVVYRMFQNCNRTDNFAFFALRETV